MSSDPIIHGMFRSLHERLYMMEEVCVAKDPIQRTESTSHKYDELLNCIQTLESRMTALESSIQDLKSTSTNAAETVHVNCIGKEPELWVKAMKDLEIVLPPKEKNPVKASSMEQEEVVVEDVEEEEDVVEVVEEEEDVVEVVEEEEAEEEDGIEVEEIIFKNKKYFKDPENNVYGVDEDENPTPDPIGVWDTGRQRVLFKRIA